MAPKNRFKKIDLGRFGIMLFTSKKKLVLSTFQGCILILWKTRNKVNTS